MEAQFARLDDEIAKIQLQAERDGAAEEVRIKSLIEAERQRIVGPLPNKRFAPPCRQDAVT